MKLKCNLTTEDTTAGRVYENVVASSEGNRVKVCYHGDSGGLITDYYDSFDEAAEMWGKCEEPKEHWAIDQFGEPINVSGLSRLQLEKLHRLGNDFPSENATMKAIEKLRAWTRLKDKGFRFERWGMGGEYGNTITFSDYIEYNDETRADLDLLFGGEE